MARIMGIDYGVKRTGLAVTDPLQIIASALDTVPTEGLLDFLKNYFQNEPVDCIVIGEPKHLDGNDTYVTPLVHQLVAKLKELYPEKEIILQLEHYTSSDAKKIIFQSGIKKQKRREKGLIDRVSAALILEEYMQKKIWNL